MTNKPHGERIAALETAVPLLQGDVTDIKKTVGEIRDMLQQAKGARWAFTTGAHWLSIVVAGLVGAVATAAASAAKLLPFLQIAQGK